MEGGRNIGISKDLVKEIRKIKLWLSWEHKEEQNDPASESKKASWKREHLNIL